MANPNPSGGQSRNIRLPSRKWAIILMIVGAVGFAASLVIFGDRVICLLGSTLITFAGLGFIIADRRSHQNMDEESENLGSVRFPGVGSRKNLDQNIVETKPELAGDLSPSSSNPEEVYSPSILPDESDEETFPVPPAAPPRITHPYILGEPPAKHVDLLNQILELLHAAGAEVTVEAQQSGRAILQITTKEGLTYTAIVHDSIKPIDVVDIRSLQALVASSGSERGYLFSSGPFTQQAYAWADARKIRLVMADELDEIGL